MTLPAFNGFVEQLKLGPLPAFGVAPADETHSLVLWGHAHGFVRWFASKASVHTWSADASAMFLLVLADTLSVAFWISDLTHMIAFFRSSSVTILDSSGNTIRNLLPSTRSSRISVNALSGYRDRDMTVTHSH